MTNLNKTNLLWKMHRGCLLCIFAQVVSFSDTQRRRWLVEEEAGPGPAALESPTSSHKHWATVCVLFVHT